MKLPLRNEANLQVINKNGIEAVSALLVQVFKVISMFAKSEANVTSTILANFTTLLTIANNANASLEQVKSEIKDLNLHEVTIISDRVLLQIQENFDVTGVRKLAYGVNETKKTIQSILYLIYCFKQDYEAHKIFTEILEVANLLNKSYPQLLNELNDLDAFEIANLTIFTVREINGKLLK
jgi:hypothetical protein